MILTIKVILTVVMGVFLFRSITLAVSVTTVRLLVERTGKSSAALDKAREMSGKKAIAMMGTMLWTIPLTVLLWVFV